MTTTFATEDADAITNIEIKETSKRLPPAHRAFEGMLVTNVYAEPIRAILKQCPGASLRSVTETFSKEYDCSVSTSTMKRWLGLMGITYERTTTWTTPNVDGNDE